MAEKMRVHILAKQLSVSSKAILTKCAAEGLPVKNHMTALSAGLEATIREWFTEGQHSTTIETAERVNLKEVRVRRARAKQAEEKPQEVGTGAESEDGQGEAATEAAVAVAEAPATPPLAEPEVTPQPEETVLEAPEAATAVVATEDIPVPDAEPVAEPDTAVPPAAAEPAEATPAAPAEAPPGELAASETLEEAPEPEAEPEPAVEPESEATERIAAKAPGEPETAEPTPDETPEEPVKAMGPQNVPAPAKLKGPRVVRYEAPDQDYTPPPRTPRRRPAAAEEGGPQAPQPDGAAARTEQRKGDARRRGGKPSASPRRTGGRFSEARAAEKLKEWRDQDLLERQERLAGATGRRIHSRRAVEAGGGPATSAGTGRKAKVELREPIHIKDFCAGVGIPFIRLMKILQRDHGMGIVNINTNLPTELAELIALDQGIELEIIKAKSALERLSEEYGQRTLKKPGPRPPVVTFLGHVDHGKTSLLDAIRRSQVAAGEDGGITQHISSYHYKRGSLAITFLDTPGHAAFTAMRARGAQATDIVVLIVAADDGVMPQTVEAINHAKAAEVPIVVAITKSDLGVFDEHRTFGQLTEHGLTPSGTWGGQTDVIRTSAVTGDGIQDLLEHLVAMADLSELTADHAGEPTGIVIEAELREGVGPAARVLVQEGKLRPGSILVCGNASGKVRALIDERGKRLPSAGPAIPCEIWGLDEVPSAGDRFYGVATLQQAKATAEEVRNERLEKARMPTQKARTLEDVFKQRDAGEVPEMNVIIRADVDGSVDALRQSLEAIPSDQVTLNIRHTGVGAVTDSDVLLADASDAVIVAFRVAPSVTTRKLAEEHGVDIREYKVIYDVVDDIVKALEGLLTPERQRELRGSADVREVFKISKVGVVAGCYVTSGQIARDHEVRLLREGVVLREECRLESLRRFKDDVKEVRAGMECGLRLEGFDDLKSGDVIEAYEIVEVARTL